MTRSSPVTTRARVRVSGKGETSAAFECEPDELILHAGLRAGIALPYECASGTCGTCKATIIDGETVCQWPEAPGHKTVKAERREFLMCQNRTVGDTSIAITKRLERAGPTRALPNVHRGTVERLRFLTPDVVSFSVSLDGPMTFAAGQFALCSVEGIPGGRAYSMVNFAPATSTLSFLVKRLAGGELTAWLFEAARDGARVKLFGPLGIATFDPELDRQMCCIAGGSGIAGMMSMLAHASAIDYFQAHSGELFFGVRTGADVFFLDELTGFARAAAGKLRVTIALSHEEPTADLRARYPYLQFATGFVHDVARPTCAASNESMFFVAGPPPMVDATLRMLLLDAKTPSERIRYDKFS